MTKQIDVPEQVDAHICKCCQDLFEVSDRLRKEMAWVIVCLSHFKDDLDRVLDVSDR